MIAEFHAYFSFRSFRFSRTSGSVKFARNEVLCTEPKGAGVSEREAADDAHTYVDASWPMCARRCGQQPTATA